MKYRNAVLKYLSPAPETHEPPRRSLLLPGLLLLLPLAALASTTGEEFLAFYQFIYDAATGYLGRGIAITGGLVMMGVAAGTGKVVIAAAGMVLAIFGALGPTIIDQIFGSALIY